VVSRRLVWTGSNSTWPTPQAISLMVDPTLPEEALEDLASQIVKRSPLQAVPGLLSVLICNYWRSDRAAVGAAKGGHGADMPSLIDIRMLQRLADSAHRSVCGVVFQQGDLVWSCRQCAKDPTCVLCDKCFRRSDHEGHEVYFYRSTGGGSGCCDCGDEEAWSRKGNCLDHNHPSHDQDAGKLNPLDALPPELVRGMRAVLRGATSVVSSYIVASVRGFEHIDQNQHVHEQDQRAEALVCRLHNDDKHTYDEVIRALKSLGLTQSTAEQLTEAVDKEGEAVVAQEGRDRFSKIELAHEKLSQDAGLLFSMVPQSVHALQRKVVCVFGWMQSLALMSDGLRRVCVEALLAPLQGQVSCFDSYSAAGELQQLDLAYSPGCFMEEADRFPSALPQLHPSGLPDLPLVRPVYWTRESAQAHALEEQGGDVDSMLESQPHGAFEADFKQRLYRPFDSCFHSSLAVMLLGSPFLGVEVKKGINDMIIQFQHDLMFKAGFSQQLTVLYPALHVLYCRSMGTMEHTVFHTSVQVYTANSVVSMMCSEGAVPGAGLRILPEDRPVMITSLLTATLQTVLIDVGCPPTVRDAATLAGLSDANRTKFLSEHPVRTHKLSHLCRDLEYLSADYGFCARLLSGDVDPGMVDIWIDLCAMLQGLDAYTRKADVHTEREDDTWQDAANLVLELETVSSSFVSRGLLDLAFTEERTAMAAERHDSGPSSAIGSSAAPAYAAPIVNPYDRTQLWGMRDRAVQQCARKTLRAITAWVSHLPDTDGVLQLAPDAVLMGLPAGSYFFIGAGRGVSNLPVSMHLPVHRLLGKLVSFAANGGVDLGSVVGLLGRLSLRDGTSLLEHPLRCLVFASQVFCGMWRRNGYTAGNLAYNYGRAPLSRTLRDMDIVSLQLAVFALGPDAFLATLVSRFEITAMLDVRPEKLDEFFAQPLSSSARGHPDLREYQPPLLSELLKLLITTATYTPACLLESNGQGPESSAGAEGWRRMLKREVVHQLLCGAQTLGQLQRVKTMVGSARTVSDSMLHAVVEDTCLSRADQDDSAPTLSLRPDSYSFFDPEFPNLTNQNQYKACDRMREQVKAHSQGDQEFIPLFSASSLPIPHKDLAGVRALLYRPLFFALLQRSVSLVVGCPLHTAGSKLAILGRVVHLATLQLALLAPEAGAGAGSGAAFSVSAQEFYREAFASGEPSGGTIARGCGSDFLLCLADVWREGTLRDDVLYHQGLGWVLQQIFTHSAEGRALLEAKGVSFAAGKTEGEGEEAAAGQTKAQRQKAAMERANVESQKRAAAAFAAFQDDISDDDADEDGAEMAVGADGKDGRVAEEPLPECIVCREKTAQPLGYLCFVQPSHVVKNALLAEPDCPDLMTVFRVVAAGGCSVFAEAREGAKVTHTLSQGQHVWAESKDGHWVQLKAPAVGWCCLYRYTDPGELPPGSHDEHMPPAKLAPLLAGGTLVVNLHPVSELQFGRHGSARLHVSHCGHTMHFDCWDMFYAANFSRFTNRPNANEALPVDVDRGESLCPLCKSVTNSLVPHSHSRSQPSSSSSSTSSPTQGPRLNLLPFQSAVFAQAEAGGTGQAIVSGEWLRSQSSLQAAQATTRSWLDGTEGGSEDRAVLASDRVFFSECSRQQHLPWDTAFKSPQAASLPPAVQLFCSLHAAWATAAYTLLSATCTCIRERNFRFAGAAGPSPAETGLAEGDLALPPGDQTLLRHLLALLWRARAWRNSFPDAEGVEGGAEQQPFHKYVSVALHTLLFDCPQFEPAAQSSDVPTPFLDANTCSLSSLRRSLATMPLETVATSLYPTSRTVVALATLALQKGLSGQEVWALLKVPLLAQDLHVMAMALVSSTSSLPAFLACLELLCLAKLAQSLLEPACIGQFDFFQAGADRHAKAGEEAEGASPTLQSDAKRREGEKDNAPCKRAKRDQDLGGDRAHSPSTDAKAAAAATFTAMREALCNAAHVPLSASAPAGLDLVALALDSWIPFLEFAYHLRTSMLAISGSDSAPAVACGTGDAVHWGLRSDRDHAHLDSKLRHALQLSAQAGLGGDAAGWGAFTSAPVYAELLRTWAGQMDAYHSFVEGSTALQSSASSASSGYSGFSTAASGPGACAWIPGLGKDSDRRSRPNAGDLIPTGATPGLSLGGLQLKGDSKKSKTMDAFLKALSGGESAAAPRGGTGVDEEEGEGEREGSVNMTYDDPPHLDYLGAVDDDFVDYVEEDEALDFLDGDEGEEDGDGDEDEVDPAAGPVTDFQRRVQEFLFGATRPGATAAGAGGGAGTDAGDAGEGGLGAVAPMGLENILDMAEADMAGQRPGRRGGRATPSWKLQGVYPINPTIDAPSTATLRTLRSMGLNASAASSWPKLNGQGDFDNDSLLPTRAPLQGSLTGAQDVVGFNGERLLHRYPDLSHFGVGLRHLHRVFIPLPTIYTDLYQMVKFPDSAPGGGSRKPLEDPAVCLVCGRLLNAGNKPSDMPLDRRAAGECTLHARSCGLGIGVFFLVQQCHVLLLRGSRASYYPSLYLDSSGEVEQRGHNRPLFLNNKRVRRLEELYLSHNVAKEIVRKRASAETVIRMNWY